MYTLCNIVTHCILTLTKRQIGMIQKDSELYNLLSILVRQYAEAPGYSYGIMIDGDKVPTLIAELEALLPPDPAERKDTPMTDIVDMDKLLTVVPAELARFHQAVSLSVVQDASPVKLQNYVSPPMIEAMLKEILDLRLKASEKAKVNAVMSADEERVLLALAMGWTDIDPLTYYAEEWGWAGTVHTYKGIPPKAEFDQELPDWKNDADACFAALEAIEVAYMLSHAAGGLYVLSFEGRGGFADDTALAVMYTALLYHYGVRKN